MKIKHIIPTTLACLLLTGCAKDESKTYESPKIQYSDMFATKSDSNESDSLSSSERKFASPASENDISTNELLPDKGNKSDNTKTPSVNKKEAIRRSYAANGETSETEQSAVNSDANPESETSTVSNPQNQENNESSAETNPNVNSGTAVKTIGKRKSSSVIYTDDQTVANLPLGDICYFPYRLKPLTENSLSPKEPRADTSTDENDEEILEFTAGISQSAADEINKLSDSKVKEIKEVVENISASASNKSGLDAETKFYVTPNAPTQQKSDNKSMLLSFAFKDAEDKDIRPQQAVTIKIPVPSKLKNSSEILVYRVGRNNTPEKTAAEKQTIDETEYIILETADLGTCILTDTEIKKADVDKMTSKRAEETIYDHGYKVVFRTDTDTYLLGTFPHDMCEWNDVNNMCREIEGLIDADCQMVGIPSLDDLKYFTKCGIYLPGQYEMWTSTPTSPQSSKAYYRNKKGAFYSTRSMTEKCGVCAIIRVSAPQDDPDLLSDFLPDYEETKARLEAEEEQYKLSISE